MAKTLEPTPSAPSTLDAVIARTAPAAFASVRAEIDALPASAILRSNLGMERAARRGLAVAERMRPLLPTLAGLPDLDHRAVAAMPRYALAVLHAHDLATEGSRVRTQLEGLLAEATPLRELMLRGAELLALAGYVSGERVAAIRSGQGHADTAADLQALGRLYRELWGRVHDKVPVTKPMVERAITLSAELNVELGGREIEGEHPRPEPNDPVKVRAKAFTLFLRAYDECSRGVSYLRWRHGDATAIVPSLYPRRSRRAGAPEEPANEPAPMSEPEPAATTGGNDIATSAAMAPLHA